MWDIRKELNTIAPRRVGLLGGTFDPIHLGHLQMAQDAIEMCELDEVCLIPCATPPHKTKTEITATEHRLAMIEAVIAKDPRLSLSLIELERGGISYTIDTVRELRESEPEIDFLFIIGADTIFELYSWKDIDKLLKAVDLVTIARPGFDLGALDAGSLHLQAEQVEILRKSIIVGNEMDISSTKVRARVAEGLSAKYIVPDPVADYIARHGLYGYMNLN